MKFKMFTIMCTAYYRKVYFETISFFVFSNYVTVFRLQWFSKLI